jgi:hypothetical protein
MWKFLDSGKVKSGVLTRAVIKLAWVKENRHAYKRSVKEPGQKVVEIALNENYPRGRSTLPVGVGMACICPHRGEFEFLFPVWGCASPSYAPQFSP